MTVVLGVDGGGTKTHALVADETGTVAGFGISGPSNWEDVGIEAAGAALRSAVREALSWARVQPEDVAATVFGLAGVDFPQDELRLSGVPAALHLTGPSRIVNDAFVALQAGTHRPWGVVVVAGSGAVTAGRNPDGQTFRTMGLGSMFGDLGSATDVSQAAIAAAAEQFTRQGPDTSLARCLCEAAGVASIVDFLEGVSRLRIEDSIFAPIVAEEAEAGDVVAREILQRAGVALGRSALLVARRLGMEGMDLELVLSGGMFRSPSRIMPAALEGVVREAAPAAKPVLLQAPPVIGAALLAMELTGLPFGEEVRARLETGALEALAGERSKPPTSFG